MSHFTCLVSAQDEEELHRKLIPYYEYGCGSNDESELLKPYLEWYVDPEWQTEWDSGTFEVIKLADGTLKFTWDEMFKVPGKNVWEVENKYPEDSERIEVTFQEFYGDYDKFMQDWHGLKKDFERGYGYWHNPNRKWDWYSVGGRWEGLLTLKDESEVNQAQIKDIDFEQMRITNRNDALDVWIKAFEVLEQLEITIEEYIDQNADKIKEAKEKHPEVDTYPLWGFEPKSPDQNVFCKAAYDGPLTYAFIDAEGKWNERATMGWWAITWDDQEDYPTRFWNFIEKLDPEDTVYVIDCHI